MRSMEDEKRRILGEEEGRGEEIRREEYSIRYNIIIIV